jgi:tetratricopeptide (TPR) repeat protein
MKVWMTGLMVALLASTAHAATDPLAEARRLYNQGQYDNAAKFAREAIKVPSMTEAARLILGRIYLEQYRRSADADDLMQAREALRAVNTQVLDRREKVEYTIGLGQALFLADRFGPAAELFERALDSSLALDSSPAPAAAAHERLLDWWASAVHRLALTGPRDGRELVYARIVERMEKELAADAASAPAAYWLAAAAHGAGNLERAWNAAMAGWVSARLGKDHGAALRADLDQLMTQGIIPDRAGRLQPRDMRQASAGMLSEWEALKASWTR